MTADRRTITARLAAIDCPESDQHWGDTAKYELIKLIHARTVRLETHGIDPYGRVVATLYLRVDQGGEWINVNRRMVTLGHARVYRHFCKDLPPDRRADLYRVGRWARSKRVGLWKTPNPVPPWTWRRKAAELNPGTFSTNRPTRRSISLRQRRGDRARRDG